MARGTAQDSVRVTFSIDATGLAAPKSFGIRGNTAPLSWEKTLTFQDPDHDGLYEGEVTFVNPSDKIVAYKFVYGDKKAVYELEGENRILLLEQPATEKNLTWDIPEEIAVKNLPLLSGKKLSADFLIFKNALTQIHPGLYRYRTREEIDTLFEHYERVFSQSMSYREAFLNFTRLTSYIQCGHTFPSFFNQNDFIRQVVLNRKDKLPFTFRIIDRRMFVTGNVSEEGELPIGTEILSIQGVETSDFLTETAGLVKADGTNDRKRFADLNTFGTGDYEMFDAYFPLLYPPEHDSYTLDVRKPDAVRSEAVTLKTISRSERKSRLRQKYPDFSTRADEPWKLVFRENNTAYLRLGTFDGFQLPFEWKPFLKDAFNQIKKRKSENLVIDIRWNEGGQDEILLYLGQHLAKTQLTLPPRQDLVRYAKVPADLRPYLFTWDDGYFDLTNRVRAVDSDYYALHPTGSLEIKPRSNAFRGNTYLLINAVNSSATFYFAEIAKANNMATLVGETTGGNQQGLNAGTMFFLRLPNSQIEVDIPIVGTFSTDKPYGGIVPDVAVLVSPGDIASGKDPVLEKTRLLIEERTN